MSFSRLCATAEQQLVSNARWTRQGSLSAASARADVLGIPFGVTIDFDTVEDRQTAQVRIPIDAIGSEVRKLVNGLATWDETLKRYPNVKVTAEYDQRGA
ncbi:hypothetical protein PsorP6_001261 [Peronosclerospora sorghi]|uniref:Uncharacterized protein n=1 Tax=Peronosclerospora sorghi TaxID=230839 RepID=A0ACC0WQW8_9STRA|nr:hypothetical protein PsorP6_001261 [Peronosclerospora sorghi]